MSLIEVKASPDRMKQKEAGLRKNCTPLLRDMAIQMEPMTIMVRLKRATIAAARFKSVNKSRDMNRGDRIRYKAAIEN